MSNEDIKAILQQQLKLMEILSQRLCPATELKSAPATSSIDSLCNSITEFSFDPQSDCTFEAWYKRYEELFNTEFSGQDDAWKVRLLLRKLGTAEHDKYINFILPKAPRDLTFTETTSILTSIFGANTSLFHTRYQCLNLVKSAADDFVTYAGIVNRECERFRLGSITPDQFKCLIFVSGLQSSSDSDIRTRLLSKMEQDTNMTLQEATAECMRLINLKRDTAMIQNSHGPASDHVNVLQRNSSQRKLSRTTGKSAKPPSACWNCGAWHFVRFCSFKQHRCRDCNIIGHKEGFCKRPNSNRQQLAKQHNQRKFGNSSVSHSNSLVALSHCESQRSRKFLVLQINGSSVRLQVDTASDITLISHSTWESIGKPLLQPTSQMAKSASGQILSLTGEIHCEVSFNDLVHNAVIYVSNHDLNLLGLDLLEKLGIFDTPLNAVCQHIRRFPTSGSMELTPAVRENFKNDIITRHSEVFNNTLGLCTQTQAVLRLKADSKPVFRPKRPVPYAAIPLIDQELNRLQSAGVITPVSYSAWAAPIVVVKKASGSIRICADYSTGLNSMLESHQYPLPVPEDLFTILNGGRYFAKLDLADAYLQVEVAPECRELLTINTHHGLFQYNRLPFGVKTAPTIFQQIMDTMLTGINGAAAYLDDIIVVGKTPEELSERLNSVLNRVQQYGFHLRPDKCEFFLQSMKYLGFIIDQHGRRPDPENIKAIQIMPPPTDVTKLRSFLGLVSYYSAFLPSMHEVRAPLNQLLTKDTPFVWTPKCQRAFTQLKSMICSDLLLTHFDPKLPIVVAADASNNGVGAVISHRFPDGSEKAIMHAARTLTSAEKNYGQIEKEGLAIIFAVKKFHKMLYGRHFTLLTDHKPLLSIFGSKKGIPVYTASRLQRWATTLLGYDFNIQYRRTTDFGQADALSRLMSTHCTPDEDVVIASVTMENDLNHVFTNVVRAIPVTADAIRDATMRDPTLQKVISYTQGAWPHAPLSGELQQFYNRRDALSVFHSCLLFSDRIVIPTPLRSSVLRQFHSGHPGVGRMKALARSFVYWPGIDKDIEDMVKRCSRCLQASKNPNKVPLQSWPQPEHPWARVHIDFAGPIDGISYLLLVDAYSKWPEIFPMRHPTTGSTITCLTRLFSQFGFPEILVSDNGTQFTSAQFSKFCADHCIRHIRSPPYHPQSNGQVERFVDTFKRALVKAKGEGTTEEIIQKFLFLYRITPNSSCQDGKSPSECLFGRRLRSTFDALKPSYTNTLKRNTPMEQQFNRKHGAKDRCFNIGDSVLVQNLGNRLPRWLEGRIVKRRGNVTYEVQVGRQVWVRHSNQLRLCSFTPGTHITRPAESNQIPLSILLDTFNLQPPPHIPTPDLQTTDATRQPVRRSQRTRRPVRPLQILPKRRSYRH